MYVAPTSLSSSPIDATQSKMGVVVPRLKREDCYHTRHDSVFSKWQILIGSNDWEDYSLGKEGVARYRVHNLPPRSSPGIYELGVLLTRTKSGRSSGKLDSRDIVVAYLGQADSVRCRLQRYGQSGSHLRNVYSISSISNPADGDTESSQKKETCGLFQEIFSRGYSVVFRWAIMKTKKNAEETEAQLLNVFDYAWNKGSNGTRRPNDILEKLSKLPSTTNAFSNIARIFMPFTQKQAGIKIKGDKPVFEDNKLNHETESSNFLSSIFKFSRSRPRLISDRYEVSTALVCRVILEDGTSCQEPPVQGRKRCQQHKGKKTYGYNSNSPSKLDACKDSSTLEDVKCGVILENGEFCESSPISGRKRCNEHKGMKINALISLSVKKEDGLNSSITAVNRDKASLMKCGVILSNGESCEMMPVVGRKRCKEHKGMKVGALISKSITA